MIGDPGFTKINYKGKPVNRLASGFVANSYKAVPVAHQYLVHGLKMFPDDPEPAKTHACLYMGWWCWPNFLEHPGQLRRYMQITRRRLVGAITKKVKR